MRTPRIVGLLAAVLVAGSAPALSTTASAAPQPARAVEATTVAIQRQYAKAIHHDGVGPADVRDTVQYAGRLTRTDGNPVERSVTLTLERRLAGQTAYHPVTSETVWGTQVAVFSTPAVRNARYRITFPGADTLAAAASAPVALKVMRDFNARKRVKGHRIWMRGNINPGWGGRVVVLQRKTCARCGWKPVARTRAKAAGAWRLRAGYPPVNRTWKFRAKIRRSPGFVKSTSAVLVTRTYYARGTASASSATLLR